jgi:hypothetical protein
MLTCYGHSVRLPQNDLAYLAFRLALQETLSDIELHLDLDEEPDPPVGYLTEVPFLEQVSLPVQADLLADAWARHHRPELTEASLLDAAVVYAACMTAGRVINDMPEVAVAMLRDGPRKVDPRIIRRASNRLDDMFDRFWDDRDFLLFDEWQDLPPDHAQHVKELLRLSDEVLEPMYEALRRWHVSADVAENLAGLLTDVEIRETMSLLDVWVSRRQIGEPEPNDEGTFVTGIEDRYHDLMVGPCDPEEAAAEAECPLVLEISMSGEDAFDCTFAEWFEHLRDDVCRTVAEGAPLAPSADAIDESGDLVERLRQIQSTGLEDGTRIEARGDAWVVVDSFYSFLLDPEDASWAMGEDDEDMPPATFSTAEAAYRAWQRSQAVAESRAKRREDALKRLRKC